MGFAVEDEAYLIVANADKTKPCFDGLLHFTVTLVPCLVDDSWIEESVHQMIGLLNSDAMPEANPSCKNCAYARQRNTVESELKVPPSILEVDTEQPGHRSG